MLSSWPSYRKSAILALLIRMNIVTTPVQMYSRTDSNREVKFTFYHAKASGGPNPGQRVTDVYEVCGQAVKSIRWTLSRTVLVERLLSRSRGREDERLVVGEREGLKVILEAVQKKKVSYEIVIVQPGISQARMTPDNISLPLASADFFITESGNVENLRVLGSA